MVSNAVGSVMALQFLELFGAGLSIPAFLHFSVTTLRLSASQSGIILAMFNSAQLLGAPIVGRLSDAYGRRGPLLACFGWTCCWFWATACVRSFEGLLFVRIMAGLSGGSIPIVQAMVLDSVPEAERASALGVLGSVQGVAFTLGPAATTVLSILYPALDRSLVFVLAGALALVACGWGCFTMEETLEQGHRRPLRSASQDSLDSRSSMRQVLDVCTVQLGCIWVARFQASFALTCLVTTYAYLVRDALGWEEQSMGVALLAAGLLGASVQSTTYPILSKEFGKHAVFILGSVAASGCLAALSYGSLVLHSTKLHIMFGAPLICGVSLIEPGFPDLVALHAPAHRIGLVQGITMAFKSAAAFFAPLCAGRVYDFSPSAAYSMAAVAFLMSGASMAVAASLSDEAGYARSFKEKLLGRLEAGEALTLLQKPKQKS